MNSSLSPFNKNENKMTMRPQTSSQGSKEPSYFFIQHLRFCGSFLKKIIKIPSKTFSLNQIVKS